VSLRGRTAVVGVAESDLGIVADGMTEMDLVGQAATAALADAGLRKDDVGAVFCASSFLATPTLHAAEYLGIRPRYSDATNIGGASFVGHLLHAACAIEAGEIETALIVYGSVQRSGAGGFVSPAKLSPYEAPYRPRWPLTMYALAAARHMHEFGTTPQQLAEVAVAAREWALRNPRAYRHGAGPLTVADVLGAARVSDPLGVLDCCLVTDGGGAVVLTSAERARTLRDDPAYLLGVAEAHWHRDISAMPSLTTTAAAESGPRAFAMAGLAPEDVDVVQLYDAFTINPILFLEDLGFCAKGDGGPFVAGGRIAPGGELAVNTNGGGLSYCHPGMYGIFMVIEAVRQMRGEAGARQQPGADVALVHGNGAVLSAQATALLGSERALG
jgi:acetyl-CoA acetyltransferase